MMIVERSGGKGDQGTGLGELGGLRGLGGSGRSIIPLVTCSQASYFSLA